MDPAQSAAFLQGTGAGVGGGTGGVGNGENAPQLQVPPLHLHCVEKLLYAQTNRSRPQLDPSVGSLSGVQYDSIGGGAQYSLGSGAYGLSCIEREEIATFPSMMMLPLSEFLELPMSIAFAMICSAKAALARAIK